MIQNPLPIAICILYHEIISRLMQMYLILTLYLTTLTKFNCSNFLLKLLLEKSK